MRGQFLHTDTLEEVPNFMARHIDIGDKWVDEFNEYMFNKGYIIMGYNGRDEIEDNEEIWIACGPAERGLNHSVLMKGKNIILHDPHPSHAGLISIDWGYRFEKIKEE
jgi:hypothetical protein